jgi:hypothetical protein
MARKHGRRNGMECTVSCLECLFTSFCKWVARCGGFGRGVKSPQIHRVGRLTLFNSKFINHQLGREISTGSEMLGCNGNPLFNEHNWNLIPNSEHHLSILTDEAAIDGFRNGFPSFIF